MPSPQWSIQGGYFPRFQNISQFQLDIAGFLAILGEGSVLRSLLSKAQIRYGQTRGYREDAQGLISNNGTFQKEPGVL